MLQRRCCAFTLTRASGGKACLTSVSKRNLIVVEVTAKSKWMKEVVFTAIVALGWVFAGLAAEAQSWCESEYAPGYIRNVGTGWRVETKGKVRYVPSYVTRNAPSEVAPLVALFEGRADKRVGGWAVYSRDGTRIDVQSRVNGFTVRTPRETFYLLPRPGGEWRIQRGYCHTRSVPSK